MAADGARGRASRASRQFLYGGLASCGAEFITMPLDVLKVRMQIQGQKGWVGALSIFSTAGRVYNENGPFGFWRGTSPAMLRQATYGTMRIGLYARFKEELGLEDGSVEANPWRKFLAGIASGSLSAAVCNPTDLIKVRMQTGLIRGEMSPRYRNIFQAAYTIIKEEGILSLYRGVGPTVSRAAVVAAAELGSYDEIKAFFKRQGAEEGFYLHTVTAALAGFCATAASSPFDVVKSRVMSQPVDSKGRGLRYNGMIDCFRKSFANEGISFMWRGFSANYLNKGPTVVIFFVLYEQIQLHLDRIFDGQK
mmetsp:Transcript_21506/g.31999  ORF Transcript_21506/g.31999 Transcript_21506/m.31999 type:complete len:308 (+) Transcript_21506:70-993(+)